MSARGVARGIGTTVKWIVIVLVGIVALVIVIAIIGLGKASNDSNKQSAQVTSHIKQVHLGMTRARVRAILGKPDSATTSTSGSFRDDLWTYGSLSTQRSYILEFQNGKLTNKLMNKMG